MKKKILLLIISCLFSTQLVSAIPAYPHPIKVQQPDGTTITIQRFGDEFYNYTLSSDGYQIVQLNDGFFYYYTPDIYDAQATRSASTSMRYNEPSRRSSDERNFVAGLNRGVDTGYEAMGLQAANIKRQALAAYTGLPKTTVPAPQADRAFEVMFPQKNIVILAEYQDIKFQPSHTKATFEALLNQEGYNKSGAIGSSKDYFISNSYGQYNPEFVVSDIVTLPEDRAHYGGNNSYRIDANVYEQVIDACTEANATVNFADYDINNDNIIDAIFIFYAGHNEAEGGADDTVWPHRSDLGGTGNFDGKRIGVYACTSELSGGFGTNLAGIGTFTHEFGHVLGLPDLYDTDYSGTGGTSVGFYNASIMGSGGYNQNGHIPPAYIGYERQLLGWANMTDLGTVQGNEVTIYPQTREESSTIYMISTEEEGEVFILESRANESWDAPLGGTGLLITHYRGGNLTYERLYQSNSLNNNPQDMYVKLVESDGRTVSGNPVAFSRLAYPGRLNTTTFTVGDYGFESDAGIPPTTRITNIVNNAGVVTLTFEKTSLATITPSQRDAIITFGAAADWKVSHKTADATEWTEAYARNATQYFLGGLEPETAYMVKVEAGSKSEVFNFTTMGLTSNTPYIPVLIELYSGDYFTPTMNNVSEPYTSITWQYGGYVHEPGAPIHLDGVGYFEVIGTIIYEDGSVEKITKYLKVSSK